MRRLRDAHVNGVGAHRLDHLSQPLGLTGINISPVSHIHRALDEPVRRFHERLLTGDTRQVREDTPEKPAHLQGSTLNRAIPTPQSTP